MKMAERAHDLLWYLLSEVLRWSGIERWRVTTGRRLYEHRNEALLQRWFAHNAPAFEQQLASSPLHSGNPKSLLSVLARVSTLLHGNQHWVKARVAEFSARLGHEPQARTTQELNIAVWMRLHVDPYGLASWRGNILPLRVARQFLDANRKTAAIAAFVQAANLNWKSRQPGHVVRSGRVVELAERDAHGVIVYIPTHFFSTWDEESGGARSKSWEKIRAIYCKLFSSLTEGGIDVVPEHQLFQMLPDRNPPMPAISFFTRGGGACCWHMRDTDFPGRVSIDPIGYWGCSTLSELSTPLRQGLDRLDLPATSALAALQRARALLASMGGDKYTEKTEGYVSAEPYIFCPLQSPAGLENHHGTVEGLIHALTEVSAASGHKVVFKRHPLCNSEPVSRALDRARKAANCHVESTSTWSLVSGSVAVVTLNSAVAIQAVLAEKRLFQLGESDVNCIAVNARSERELASNLQSFLAGRLPDTDLRLYRNFCWFYFERYLVEVGNSRDVRDRIDLVIRAASTEATAQAYLEALLRPPEAPAPPPEVRSCGDIALL